MRSLRMRLEEARKRLGLPWEVLERDYLLSWFLAGIGEVEILRDTLIFKGGRRSRNATSETIDFRRIWSSPARRVCPPAMRWNEPSV